MIKMLKGVLGRCSMIPLTLALGPIEVNPAGQTKKTVYVMHIKKDIKLAELAQVAQLPPAKVLIPEPETEEPPEDLFPEGAIAELESKVPKQESETEELFPEEEAEIPLPDEELLKGWQIVKGTVEQLNITDGQIKKWFSHFEVEVGLADFNEAFPPDQVTNEMVSKFKTMLDLYRERQTEKEQK